MRKFIFVMRISHSTDDDRRICRSDWHGLGDNCIIMNHFIFYITYRPGLASALNSMTIVLQHRGCRTVPDLAMGRNKNVINCSIYLVWWAPTISRFNWNGQRLHHAYDNSENGKASIRPRLRREKRDLLARKNACSTHYGSERWRLFFARSILCIISDFVARGYLAA